MGVKRQLWHAVGTEQMLLKRASRRQHERDRLQELLELMGRMKAVEYLLSVKHCTGLFFFFNSNYII